MEFGLLGPLTVRVDGALAPVPPGAQRAVLATLLLNDGRLVRLDELAEVLWGADSPRTARVAVQNHVMRLRKALGAAGRARIRTEPGGYLIRVLAGELDVSRFESLLAGARAAARDGAWDQSAAQASAALTLWRGDPLADTGSETLLQRELPRLAELRLQALEVRIEAELRLGPPAAVIGELRQLASVHPMREHLHALLMLALFQDGRQGEALAVYRQVRAMLVAELGAEPGARLRELQLRILHGDPSLTAVRQPGSPQRAVRPAQLPGPVRYFTGRDEELRLLTALADQAGSGSAVISVIAGTAGVGKTALAVWWANQVTGRFPDGQLYLNLRGFGPGQPMSAADALAALLRRLGVHGQDIPAATGERAERYQALLAGRRMLVLLDNAASAAQVRPLLPAGATCVTVVTSRDALAGLVARDGAVRLDLDLLPLADATSLLRAMIGARAVADPAATALLAVRCCRLPLALRVAAEVAVARPAISIATLAEELADQRQRLSLLDAGGDPDTAIRAVFSWSCRDLAADAVRLFRMAGLHPGPSLDRYAAAALTGGGVPEADGLLRVLTRACLIQPAGPDQYGMHDLLRAYACELAASQDSPRERKDALTRLFDHYLRGAAAAMDILYPAERHRRPPAGTSLPVDGAPLTDAAQARAWLDDRRDSMVAAAIHAAGHGWPGHATQLAATLDRYLYTRGYHAEAIAIHTCTASAARAAGDHRAEAESLTSLGAVAQRQGRYRQSAAYLRQALGLFRQAGSHDGQARVLRNLGTVSFRQGRYRQAASQFVQALTLYRQAGDRAGEASALGNLGGVDVRRGQYQAGADRISQSLTLYHEIGDRRGEAYTLGNLGFVHVLQGEYQQAATQYRQALALCREIGYRDGEASALSGLGDVDQGRGRHARAAGHYRRALALFQDTGNGSGEAAVRNDLGSALRARGQPDQAIVQHQAALALASRIGDKHEQARAHDGLGHAHAAAGRPDQAVDHWQQALARYTSLGAPEASQVRARLREAAHRL